MMYDGGSAPIAVAVVAEPLVGGRVATETIPINNEGGGGHPPRNAEQDGDDDDDDGVIVEAPNGGGMEIIENHFHRDDPTLRYEHNIRRRDDVHDPRRRYQHDVNQSHQKGRNQRSSAVNDYDDEDDVMDGFFRSPSSTPPGRMHPRAGFNGAATREQIPHRDRDPLADRYDDEHSEVSSLSSYSKVKSQRSCMISASVVSAALGFLGGGPVAALVMGLSAAYATKQDGPVGDSVRAVGQVALLAKDKVVELDEKHQLVDRSKNAAAVAWEKAKEMEESHRIMDRTKTLMEETWCTTVRYVRRHDIIHRGIQNLGGAVSWIAYQMTGSGIGVGTIEYTARPNRFRLDDPQTEMGIPLQPLQKSPPHIAQTGLSSDPNEHQQEQSSPAVSVSPSAPGPPSFLADVQPLPPFQTGLSSDPNEQQQEQSSPSVSVSPSAPGPPSSLADVQPLPPFYNDEANQHATR